MTPTSTPPSLSTRLVHLWEKRHTPEGQRLIKYSMVSVISTVVSLVALALVFGLLLKHQYVLSTVIANVVATIPSYFLNRKWVWGKGGRSRLTKEIIPFWTLSALGIFVSIGGASLAGHIAKTHHLGHLEQTGLVMVANLLSFGVFWVLKFMVFNRIFQVHTLEELDELVEAA